MNILKPSVTRLRKYSRQIFQWEISQVAFGGKLIHDQQASYVLFPAGVFFQDQNREQGKNNKIGDKEKQVKEDDHHDDERRRPVKRHMK